ncbi:uncharacterized protein LOC127832282 isoform X2 [Dreissena polymorpha]|uniref:Uncharacterized protein n=1 Tax=Dreissena polymorpha TaxID=45954 RepID=A0A9D4GJ09_DREPO|nr:uncharacterized protein LOC127832282 isoform X2 [Dreissena polymorpha]KAH3816356.1 hypothetical protein DPMN_117871 [Dreissena polymorpha]
MNKSFTLCKFSPLRTPTDKKTFPTSPKKTTVPSKSPKKSKKKHKVSKDVSVDSPDSYVTALTSDTQESYVSALSDQPISDTSGKKKKSRKKDKPHCEDITHSSILLDSDCKQLEQMGSLSTGAEMIGELTSPKRKKSSKKSKKLKRSHHMSSIDDDVTPMQSPTKKVRFMEQGYENLNEVLKSGGKTTPSEVESSEIVQHENLEKSADVDISLIGNRAKYEFKTPDHYKLMDLKHCFTKSELQGKKLFLIQAPKQFDFTTLDNQKISLSSTSIITNNMVEGKQFEVTPREYDTKKGSGIYSMVVDKNSLTVGESIQGHLQITDWYPGIPPVVLDKTLPRKHRVEGINNVVNTDDVVGSKNVDTEEVSSKKQKKKKKKEKKKDRKK